MLRSHCGENPCECKQIIFAANSPEIIRLPGIITEKVWPYKLLRMAITLRSLRLDGESFVSPFAIYSPHCQTSITIVNGNYECSFTQYKRIFNERISCVTLFIDYLRISTIVYLYNLYVNKYNSCSSSSHVLLIYEQ